MRGITPRQQEVLTYITDFIATHKYAPSYREIMRHFNFSSVGTVAKFIEILKSKELLLSENGRKRSLVPIKTLARKELMTEYSLPFIGKISAESPIVIFTKSKSLAVPSNLLHAPEITYILQAEGHSLNEEHIAHGDYLIVEARQEVHPGETVIALMNTQDAIVKRYYPENGYVKLIGHNPQHPDLTIREEEIRVQGVLIGVIRFYV